MKCCHGGLKLEWKLVSKWEQPQHCECIRPNLSFYKKWQIMISSTISVGDITHAIYNWYWARERKVSDII